MKKIYYLFLILFVASFTFTACEDNDDDDTPKPTISVTPSSPQTGYKGDKFDFTVIIGSNENIESFSITPDNTNGAMTNFYDTTYSKNTKNETINYTYEIPTSGVSAGDVINIKFTVTDKNASSSVTVQVNVELAGFANTETGFFYHISAPEKGAWDMVNDVAMASSDNDASKDVVNDDSPGSFTGKFVAGTGSGTQFYKDNTFNYNTASAATVAAAFKSPVTTISNPQVGDVILVYLRGTDYAVMKITEIDPTAGTSSAGNKGKLTFEYKKD